MADKKKILLVEDEEVVAGAASRILNIEGFEIEMTSSAEQALEKLNENQYHLLLSDLMLPGMSGLELIQKIRGIYKEMPIIIVSGYASLANALKAFKEGAFDFIPKPFDFEELAGVVYRAIQHSGFVRDRVENQTEKMDINASFKIYSLGEHSWARIDQDGSVVIGVGETFAGCMGKINWIELPSLNDEISQGNLCARIISQDYLNHMVWAPLSGKVVGLNTRVETDINLINTSPFKDGWLMKIVPTNRERELENLGVENIPNLE